MSPDLPSSLRWLMRSSLEAYLRVYHRHEIHLDADLPEPALHVSNHGLDGYLECCPR